MGTNSLLTYRIAGIITAAIVYAIVVLLVFAWLQANSPDPATEERPAVFRTVAEGMRHKRLLAKQGLAHDVAVILEDPLGRYFIRDGRRCAFR